MAGMAEAVGRQLERLHHLLEVLRPGEEPATKLGHCAWCWGRWPAVIGRRRSRQRTRRLAVTIVVWRMRMRLDAQNPFQPVQRTRAAREIEAQIRELIAGGQAKSGDRLPSERVLAHALGVGRSTLREAIRILEFLGLLDVRPGTGTFVAAPAVRRGLGSEATAPRRSAQGHGRSTQVWVIPT